MQNIYIAGYPRSGNVWLSRLLSDIFNCSVVSIKGRKSIAERVRPNKDYRIVQEHFFCKMARAGETKFINRRDMHVNLKRDNDYILFVYRNPLDVAVSVYKYWQRNTLREALEIMKNGGHVPVYVDYMTSWVEANKYVDKYVSFEQMKSGLTKILSGIALDNKYKGEVDYDAIIRRNHIANTRRRAKSHPENFTYNFGIQSRHMRKGIAGDWINHFTVSDLEYALDFLSDFMITFGYFDKGTKSKEELKQTYLDILRNKN